MNYGHIFDWTQCAIFLAWALLIAWAIWRVLWTSKPVEKPRPPSAVVEPVTCFSESDVLDAIGRPQR